MPLLVSPFNEGNAQISPDGRWMAYVSNESGRYEVYVQRFPDLGGKVTISTDGGTQPVWSRDGRELFYRSPSGMMEVSDRFFGRGPVVRNFDVAADGRFLMIYGGDAGDADAPPLNVVLNWFDELEERLPDQ